MTERQSSFVESGLLRAMSEDVAVTIIGKGRTSAGVSEPHRAQRLRWRRMHTPLRSAPCPILPMALVTKEWL
jgi:hypothetical protein